MNKFSAPGFLRTLRDSSGDPIEGETKTTTFQSESLQLKGYLFVGLFLKVSSVTGSSPEFDVDVEISPDNGTTWYNMPQDINSTTQAAMTQLTAAGQEFKMFAVPALATADTEPGVNAVVRFVFTIAGTSPSFDVDHARYCFFAGTN